ncbi:hypothetical protein KP509_25G070400 [Ceratopteris richardii]|uniref:Pentatricopeptide repeat-containing protein n=1 Tax=Ceratopteris richardii TaxID=49495 RepID=A0A8T2RTF8_CERRI|nr:hypothetical protein KP509_25G070400 [Ceratopteris richardii]KAH7299038.1 hypothetical protein KP509_25G070400 [Ceratopteris richardii]KAH7299039.1 hypothetical protein KP509_25G070400 [Ceratopteris richardii]KAH7299040.1 hypothetical protein KP509_25G070400 [Ceratopteris richardii]KAH7299041.1 hypothetical protein KP509_25G070400 [Ceratopteris richardii]
MLINYPKVRLPDGLSRHADHIRSLCRHGRLDEAFKVVEGMEGFHLPVPRDIVYSLLQGCHGIKNLLYARRIRSLMQKHGLHSISALGDHLIRLFTLCGSLSEANEVFADVPNPSVFTWNSLISAHSKLGEGFKALQIYERMQHANQVPDRVTLVCVSHACGRIRTLLLGMHVHHQAIINGFESDLVFGNAVIEMYASCGRFAEAHKLFNRQIEKDIVTWTVIISGYVTHDQGLLALEFCCRMHTEGLTPSKAVLLCIIKACICERALDSGQLIHAEILENSLDTDMVLMSSLADMYAKCGCLEEAEKVFSASITHDVVAWTTMIDGYAHSDKAIVAFQLLKKMLETGVEPNKATFLGMLKACSTLCGIQSLRSVHLHILERGLEMDMAVGSALVDVYARCKLLDDAYAIFMRLPDRNVMTWGGLISGFFECGETSKALDLFNGSLFEGIEPSVVTSLCVLKACSKNVAIEEGLLIHALSCEMGYESDQAITNTLVDFYSNIGDLNSAQIIFDCLSNPDAVSFGALINGYANQGCNSFALCLFDEMQKQGLLPDRTTVLSLLKACTNVGSVGQGQLLHKQIVMNGLETATVVNNALVDMYAKTGRLHEAQQLCAKQPTFDGVTFTSIIGGSEFERDSTALKHLIRDASHIGCDPDNVIFASVLSAYGSTGLLHEGYDLFTSIYERNCLISYQDYCSSVVDLLGRSGQLQTAKDLSLTMPVPPDVIRLTSLATNSKTYCNVASQAELL